MLDSWRRIPRGSEVEKCGTYPYAGATADITTDDVLHAAYLERIPVVALDGVELFEHFVDEPALRDQLGRVSRR